MAIEAPLSNQMNCNTHPPIFTDFNDFSEELELFYNKLSLVKSDILKHVLLVALL